MQVLVIGSGAREHAICDKILKSPLLKKLYLFGANDGFCFLGEVLDAKNWDELVQISLKKDINLVIIGPEKPLMDGVVDKFLDVGIKCIGLSKKWAQLEGSKVFAKAFLEKYGIKTAKYEFFSSMPKNLETFSYPLVIKADGLCAGKGVKILQNVDEAKNIISNYLDGQFGEASKTFILEEFLDGEELSLMCLFDGKTLLDFAPCRDFKKLYDDINAPNTGGMGAYCPVRLSDFQREKLSLLKKQLQEAFLQEGMDFSGIIYAGLIFSRNDFYVLEFNVRFGDPETQALLMSMENDLLDVFKNCIEQNLQDVELKYKEDSSACLVIAAKGYPENPTTGGAIKNIPEDVQVYYAGVKKIENALVASGGRVLSLCMTNKNPYDKLLQVASLLDFEDKYYRDDLRC